MAKALVDTLNDVKAEALLHTLPDTLVKVKAEKFGDTLGDAKAETLVETLADTLIEVKAEALDHRVTNT